MKTQIATIFAIGWLGQAMATDFTFALECKTAGGEGSKFGFPAFTNTVPGVTKYYQVADHTEIWSGDQSPGA